MPLGALKDYIKSSLQIRMHALPTSILSLIHKYILGIQEEVKDDGPS